MNAWTCGLHSGIPVCCIRLFAWTTSAGLTETYREAEDLAWCRWQRVSTVPGAPGRVWVNDRRELKRPGWFIPCQNHRKVRPAVTLRPCACHKRAV